MKIPQILTLIREDDSNSTRTLDIYLPYVCKVSICRLVWVAIVLSTAKAMREPVTRIKQIVFPHLSICNSQL